METKQSNLFKHRIIFTIILLLVGIYASFLSVDILTGMYDNKYSTCIKIFATILCFVLSLIIGNDGHSKKGTRLLQAACFLTLIADFSIEIASQFLFGIGVFLFVQILYIVRHKEGFRTNKYELFTSLIIFSITISILFVIGSVLLKKGETVLFIAIVIYAMVLSTSLWMAIGTLFRKYFPKTICWFIALGMACFFICDINVGISQALPIKANRSEMENFVLFKSTVRMARSIIDEDTIEIDKKSHSVPFTLKSVSRILVWFFYLPAQFLLVLSGYNHAFLRKVNPLRR